MLDESTKYFSTREAVFGNEDLEERVRSGDIRTVGLAEAIITGQAPDGGLFMPTQFPQISSEQITRLRNMHYANVFVAIMKDFFQSVLSDQTLDKIANEAYGGENGFEPFLERISENDIIARLDEGPTEAFKDYAAQVLFRIVDALIKEEPKSEIEFRLNLKSIKLLTYIVATSGDTGGAMGDACLGLDKMWMVILHSAYSPEHVSHLQANHMKRLEDLGFNINVLRLLTDFDGCQSTAQRLQNDLELKYMHMTSANSINIGRLIPQIAYYFDIYSCVAETSNEEVYFSVPSGNFGDAVAGLFAIKMGLPIKLIVSVNENDVFKRFYTNEVYEPGGETHPSPSSAMNVENPSNVRRLVQLYGGQIIGKDLVIKPDFNNMKEDIPAVYSISNQETFDTIQRFWDEYHRIGKEDLHSTLEPHGAVAYAASERFREQTRYTGKIVTFETAHPGKFPETLEQMGIIPKLPPSLRDLENYPNQNALILADDYDLIKGVIKQLYGSQLAMISK